MNKNGAVDAFVDTIGTALAEPHPLALLQMASTVIAALDPERVASDALVSGKPARVAPALGEFCQTLLSEGSVPTLSLASVIGELSGDELLRARIRRELAAQKRPLPGWVRRLDQVRVRAAIAMTDVLGDGQNIVIEAQLPNNHSLSVLSYVDHNVGTLVKDAFVIPEPLDRVWAAWHRAESEQPDLRVGSVNSEMSLADARARLLEAIERGHMTEPPFETESWPACEPLLAWLLRSMPPGGDGYPHSDVTDEQLDVQIEAFEQDFFQSSWGMSLDTDAHHDLFFSFLVFSSGTAAGDPLRWSMVTVELLLMDWLLTRLTVNLAYLTLAPDLLRAVIRFSHNRRDIPVSLTEETLASVDTWEPRFREQLADMDESATQIPDGFAGGDSTDSIEVTEDEYYEYVLEALGDEVGGLRALTDLSDKPLPSASFDWVSVPEDIRPRVEEVLTLVDVGANDLFDGSDALELGRACRRMLARVAAADPAIFRRKSSANTAAAAVVWVIAKANDALGQGPGQVMAKTLQAQFGTTGSVSQRAEPMLAALGATRRFESMGLGDPQLLTSAKRRQIIQTRDSLFQILGG